MTVATLGTYDFSNPFMRATLIKGGQRYPLWLGDDPSNPVRLTGFADLDNNGVADDINLPSLAYTTSVTVDLGLGYVPRISVTLSPPFLEARKFLESTLIEWTETELEVIFGYLSGMDGGPTLSPPYTGLVMKPDVSLGSDITISLTAQGTGGYRLASTNNSQNLPKQTRSRHILDLAQKLKLTANPYNWDLDDDSYALLNREEEVATTNKSFLSIIYDLARRSKCWLDLRGDNIGLRSMSKVLKGDPVAILRLYDLSQSIGPSLGVFPILSVSTDNSGIYLSAQTKTLLARDIDAATRQQNETKAGPGTDNNKVTTTGEGQVAVKNDSTTVSETAIQIDANAPDSFRDALAEYQSYAQDLGIKLEVETIGFPDILPGQILQVEGVGKRLDARYAVFNVKHNLSSSGFTTSLTLVQNSASLTTALQKTFIATDPSQAASLTPNSSASPDIAAPIAVTARPQS